MKNIIRLPDKNLGAIGRVCIDYTDPLTGKIKEQIKGNNHVFSDCLFGTDWMTAMSNVPLYVTDSRKTIDSNLPYVLGTVLGYGYPGATASGLNKGAWNSVTGFLSKQTSYGYSSKFVYDFTPIQALGTVGTIGLTYQNSNSARYSYKQFKALSSVNTTDIGIGMYRYNINTSSAIVTKKNIIDDTYETIEVSSIVGTADTKRLGYEPSSGHFFIWVYSSTAASRKIYEFLDDSFSSAINIWLPTNINRDANFYVNSGNMYFINTSQENKIYKADFINNTAVTSITVPINIFWNEAAAGFHGTIVYNNYILAAGIYNYKYGSGDGTGIIFDLESEQVIAYMCLDYGYTGMLGLHPYSTNNVFCIYEQSAVLKNNNAIAAYKVPDDAPTRPDGYGMTITYELEVIY
jgi:hypothetical protein